MSPGAARSNKKQNVVSKSSAEAEYKSMTHIACEMMWNKSLLLELGFTIEMPILMHCDNKTTIFIADNPTFHERTKYIEVDYHYVRNMVMKEIISTPYTQSSEQLADIFTNELSVGVFESLCTKLSMIDMYTPA